MKQEVYEYWLYNVPNVGWKTIQRLFRIFGTPEEVYRASPDDLKKQLSERQAAGLLTLRETWDLEGAFEKMTAAGIQFLTATSPAYPGRLQEIPDPPYGIFYKGSLPRDEALSVAVIGARECSEYGCYVAKALGKAFAENGVQVISGMARGIDGISQEAALDGGGCSFGVLGCGVDICYPAQNRPLYERLLEKGGVLSSYPPGTRPQPSLFPPRNRIVSGLADAVIVVEARQRSGTLITVDMALEQGREVYVVPGRLTDRLSDGCNQLIRQGAGVLLSPESFLQELSRLFPRKGITEKPYKSEPEMGTKEQAAEGLERHLIGRPIDGSDQTLEEALLSRLDFYPKSVEQLGGNLPGSPGYHETLAALMRLCLRGLAAQSGVGYFHKKG